MLEFLHWIENHMVPCLFKVLLGIECPGCGTQRSILELLKGHFMASLKLYPPLIFIIFCSLLTIAHIILKLKNGAVYVKYATFTTITIVFISYFIKISG